MKKITRRIHLWLGLMSGLVIIVVCLSGAVIAFTEEALNIINKDYLFVEKASLPRVQIEEVIANYKKQHPNEEIFIFNTYRQENRSFDFFSAVKTGKDKYSGYKMVYVNPYSGEIIRVDKGTLETIVILLTVHTSLFLGEAGEYIIQIATLIFLIQIIGGLILWWPKSRNALNTVFKIKTSGSKKRLNYDLHRTVGFYACILLIALVGTGLIMAWDFIRDPIVNSLGGKSEFIEKLPLQPPRQSKNDYPYNLLLAELKKQRPSHTQFTFFLPSSDTITVINGRTNQEATFLNFEVGQYFQFNRYDGKAIGGEEMKYVDRNNEILSTVLLIHMGFWGGMPTKILTFLAGIIGASLPVTGFLIWRGRNKKKKPSKEKLNASPILSVENAKNTVQI